MIFIPEDFKFNHIKKTNIVAKLLLEGAIREIKKCPKEYREMLLSQCAPWHPDDYNIEYKEMSAGFQNVKYAEHTDHLGWTVFFYLRFEIDKYLIESCQMRT